MTDGKHLLRTLREWIVDEFDGADAGDIVAQIDRLLALPAAAEPASELSDDLVLAAEQCCEILDTIGKAYGIQWDCGRKLRAALAAAKGAP